MRLLFVISSLRGGGAEGVLSTLSNQLANMGHSVTLVTHLGIQVYHIDEKVNLIDCRDWQYDASKGNIVTRVIKKVLNRILDYKKLKRIVNKEKPELVMSFLLQWQWQLILICKRRVPIVFASRNAYERSLGNYDFFTKKVLWKMADVLLVTSLYDVAYLHRKYKQVATVPNPLRYEPMKKEEYVNTFDRRKNILACGRITPQKGFENLILAFMKIAKDYPDWDIDICGQVVEKSSLSQNYAKYIEKLIENNGLKTRVHFIGFHSDIDKVMRNHSVFCLSSVNEGFPNVLSEAMAMGCCCVSYDIVTGPREIIIDGLDGVIVENHNIDDLSKMLATVMKDKSLRFEYGLKAIEDIARFKKDKVMKKWEDLLTKIIDRY